MSDHRKREHIKESDSCHVLLALKRKKENEDTSGVTVFRQIVRNQDDDLKVIISKCKALGGNWRIYHTVNKRNFEKANTLFKHRLIDDYDDYYYRIDSLWVNCLLKKESRETKRFLIDYDGDDIIYSIIAELESIGVNVLFNVGTPNGYHVVIEPFDVNKIRKVKGLEDVDILKDGYFYLTSIKELEE